ncbi:MAG: PP2C family protein-serine/threonine phosphatase [Vicinamibacteria bacterium]
MTDPRKRFEEFAAKLGDTVRQQIPRRRTDAPRALKEDFWRDYWEGLQDLFTRDVTGKGLQELVQQDARDTLRFFTREVEFADLRDRPWHHRYPLALWRVFEAMAYRLSPARRILFALAVPVLFLGWLRYLGAWVSRNPFGLPPMSWEAWLLGGASIVFFLLVLELKDKLALKGDLEIARQIQFGLLPFEPFCRGGISVETSMRPANTVGGDYFDLIDLGDGRTGLVVGDVAGKGMPAALLMALLQGSLRTLISAGLRGGEMMARLNDHLCANIPSNRLITLFYAEIDGRSGEMWYVNAGHNPPFMLRGSGGQERLRATSVALGILPGEAYPASRVLVGSLDRLLLYTDGVTEAFNTSDEEYGEARLAAYLEIRSGATLKELVSGLIESVLAFCGSERPRDDMTLMAVSRVPV